MPYCHCLPYPLWLGAALSAAVAAQLGQWGRGAPSRCRHALMAIMVMATMRDALMAVVAEKLSAPVQAQAMTESMRAFTRSTVGSIEVQVHEDIAMNDNWQATRRWSRRCGRVVSDQGSCAAAALAAGQRLSS